MVLIHIIIYPIKNVFLLFPILLPCVVRSVQHTTKIIVLVHFLASDNISHIPRGTLTARTAKLEAGGERERD